MRWRFSLHRLYIYFYIVIRKMDRERIVTAAPEDVVLYDSSVRALNGKDPYSEASKILLGINEEASPKVRHEDKMGSRERLDKLSHLVEKLRL